jgi:hypothetical protein
MGVRFAATASEKQTRRVERCRCCGSGAEGPVVGTLGTVLGGFKIDTTEVP